MYSEVLNSLNKFMLVGDNLEIYAEKMNNLTNESSTPTPQSQEPTPH